MNHAPANRCRHRVFPPVCALVLLLPVSLGCWSRSADEVVVYTALDREFSEPLLDEFQRQTGIRVLAKYDVESTKTVGLVNAIIQEQARPRCDVFWNNEIMHTLRLEKQGLLAAYSTKQAEGFPSEYRSPGGTWYGFAARVRVLIVNTQLVPEQDRPQSIRDLIDPKWKGRVGVAKPLFGTTATHAAVLFAHWGEAEARQFFLQLKDNAQVLSGNKQIALSVGRGELAFGVTDTDDAMIEKENGQSVEIVYPDQEEGGLGALFIPNTLAMIQGAPNTQAARRLVDYLLSPEVETQLAAGPSAQFPLNSAVSARCRAAPPQPLRHMAVDFPAAAAAWDSAAVFLRDTFATD
jgi:iron(III) transport system substrate-binding protein